MSHFQATLIHIESLDLLHSITLDFEDILIYMVLLELPKNLQINNTVTLSIKPTNISLSTQDNTYTSFINKIPVYVENYKNGQILSYITVKTESNCILEIIMSSREAIKLNLYIGQKIYAFIRTTDISIAKPTPNV